VCGTTRVGLGAGAEPQLTPLPNNDDAVT